MSGARRSHPALSDGTLRLVTAPSVRNIRCAIYTRKSTEEGLNQAFNSLDAQREACSAYVLSQAGEGWSLTPALYDDGGYSGGSMDRPALLRLLADIARGQIDVVVVYKIDRLTRSLADFSKIVERLDARGASFVSVTQAFNTTTSMGRLTLNVLLSFAQFEREVGAERVRDKIAASRKKGMWMGGNPALGYDVADRKLVINAGEAETIRFIFARYLQLHSLAKLKAEIEAKGIKTKSFVARTGRQIGGQRWYVGPLRHLLRNRVYIGESVHKGIAYPGLHAPILDAETFNAAQATLDASRVDRKERIVRRSPGLLTGLVFDDAGNAMSPQATTKRGLGERTVYYVSQAILQRRENRGSLPRVSARKLEGLITEILPSVTAAASALQPKRRLDDLTAGPIDDVRSALRTHIKRVTVSHDAIIVDLANLGSIDGEHLAIKIESALASGFAGTVATSTLNGVLNLHIPVCLAPYATTSSIRRAAGWTGHKVNRDQALIRALALAHRWKRDLVEGRARSTEAIAATADLDRNTVRNLLRLAFLAPDLQIAVLDGTQSPHLTVRHVLQNVLTASWDQQRKTFALVSR